MPGLEVADSRVLSSHTARLFERSGPAGLERAHPGDECLLGELGGDGVVNKETAEQARADKGIGHVGSLILGRLLEQRAGRTGDGVIPLKLDHALITEVATDT